MKTTIRTEDSPIEYALLGLLARRPMHGYELHRELSRKSELGLIWTVKQAQLYAILSKFESKGLVKAEVVPQGARPARRVLRLTREGRRAYTIWVATPAERKDFRLVFLAKLFFARREGVSAANDLVALQREFCSSWLADMRERGAAHEPGSLDGLVYRYRIGQLGAMMAWLDECADLFQKESIAESDEKGRL